MKWLDRIVTRAASGVETRALPGAGAGFGNTIAQTPTPKGGVNATIPTNYSSPGTPQLPQWDGRAAIENGYYQSVWVQRTLGMIAETIASLPFVAGMDLDNPAATNPQAMLARLLGPATPQAPGGPHNGTSSQAFFQWSIIQKLATGKMVWEYQVDQTTKGPTGQPAIIGLWPLPSFLVNPVPSPGGSSWWSGFKYQLPTGEIDLKPERVFYAWKRSQRDWRQPESYLEAAALPISISVAIERYNWALLQNGMVATHVVTSAPLEEPDNRRAWEEQFISNFTGFDQAGKPIFAYADVENGKVTDAFNIQSIAQTSQQAELLQLAAWVKTEILVATGVPESLIGNATARIYANADSESRTFWTTRIVNVIAELQDDINTTLAPLLGPEVGWFDLSRVAALQPPTPFMQPQLSDLIAAGIMTIPEAQLQLGVSDSGFIDTSDMPIGEESSSTGAGAPGKASAPMPELRGWSWEYRGMNTHTFKNGTWRRLIHQREKIVVRPTKLAPVSSSLVVDTRGYDRAEKILDRVVSLREKREANTLADKVYAYLQQNYPPSVLGWIKKATWRLDDAVPLDEIKMARRPGGRDLDKVEAISDAIQGGKKMEPVVLVDIGGDRYVVADGYHRTLAFQKAGKKTIAAYVASGVGDHGPWDTAMHDAKLNRADDDIERRTPNTAEASSTHVPVGPGELWHDPTIHLPDYIEHVANAFRAKGMPESEAIAQAVGVVRDWSEGKTAHGHVHPDVQAAAAKAIAEWDALKASHNKSKRAFVAETGSSGPGAVYKGNNPDASGAGLLLPLGPTKKPVPREAELVGPHRYLPDPSNAKRCLKCGKGPLAAVHKAKAKADPAKRTSVATVEALLGRPVESRHRGPDHVHVPTGHANTPARKRLALKQAYKAALAGYEQQFAEPMKALFAKQQVTTLSRLNGRRGRQMIRRATEQMLEARASSQPGSSPTPPSDGVPVTTAAPTSPAAPTFVDPAAIFDSTYWLDKTIAALEPGYRTTADGATSTVRAQLGTPVTEEMHSLSNAQVRAALLARANAVGAQINQTTLKQIAAAIADGMEQGEGIPQLAERVKGVFKEATDNRATMVARTESHSAVGVASDTYVNSLPQGIVAGKEWLAIHDDRTRPAHRLADGQRQPLGVPFRVGGFPLQFPGDPAGPPGDVINCRCAVAYIPQSQAHLLLQQPPKDFTYNPQAPTAA